VAGWVAHADEPGVAALLVEEFDSPHEHKKQQEVSMATLTYHFGLLDGRKEEAPKEMKLGHCIHVTYSDDLTEVIAHYVVVHRHARLFRRDQWCAVPKGGHE